MRPEYYWPASEARVNVSKQTVHRMLPARGSPGAILLVAGLSLTTNLAAQAPNPTASRLANAKSLQCTFTQLATGTWVDGAAQAMTRPAKLTLGFTAIDTQDGTADSIGSSGKAHITVRVVGNYLSLMQLDPYGALHVTTVFNTVTKTDRLQAVHTRHEYTAVQLPGLTSRPEQYYGDCAIN